MRNHNKNNSRIAIHTIGQNNNFDGKIQNYTVNSTPLPFSGLIAITNLSAYYKCDESSGNILDSAANGLNFTQNNNIGSAAGKIGNCRVLANASVQYGSRASASGFQSGASSLTIAMWYNRTSAVSYGGLFCKYLGSGGLDEYALYELDTTGKLRFGISNNGSGITDQVDSTITHNNGEWHFVIAWYDVSQTKIFISVDNETPVSATYSIPVTASSAPVAIGSLTNNGSGGFTWDGKIDEISIWKRTLTAAERTALYNAGIGLTY